jgi:cytochrome P450
MASRGAMPGCVPMPARVGGPVRRVGAGLALLAGPTDFFARQRARHGDTFVVDALGHRFFCVFGPEGVRRLYELPEQEASFGLATYRLISAKAPEELFAGRRVTPHHLFGNQDVSGYLGHLRAAVADELDRLGDAGTFDVFAEMRRLSHALGLASWAGPECAAPRRLDRLVGALDVLDPAEAFVRPVSTLYARATGKRRERAALTVVEREISAVIDQRSRAGGWDTNAWPDDSLTRIWNEFADLPDAERRVQVARDVVVIHMGSMSNLYAALAWTLIDVVDRPPLLERVRAGDVDLLERAASESTRVAQRSITLREVLRPLDFDDGDRTYRLEPGVLVTTMLSVNNTTAVPALAHYDPDHYDGRRLTVALPAKELVSTFGHGRHSCPAARFSVAAITTAVGALVDTYDLERIGARPRPRRRQIGGVARAERPCRVRYHRRAATGS